jgi:hypothetical protein
MAPNQFACGLHASGPSTLQTLIPTPPCTLTVFLPSIPWPAYFRLCKAVGAHPYVNLTRTCTQACVNQIVADFKTVFPTAQPHYVEISNEPWNLLFPDYWYFVSVSNSTPIDRLTFNGGDSSKTAAFDPDGAGSAVRGQQLGRLFGRGATSGGSGVGLYLVRALMERMGGRAEFHSSPGNGFCAELSFSASREAAAP